MLDLEQVKELIFNGFTREHACEAVAESHGHPRNGLYMNEMLSELPNEALPGEVDFIEY